MIEFFNWLIGKKEKSKSLVDKYWDQYKDESEVCSVANLSYIDKYFDNGDNGISIISKCASDEEIRELAYLKWEQAGKPECDGNHFWDLAKQELEN